MAQTLCIFMLFALSASTLGLQPPSGMGQCKTDRNIPADFESQLVYNPESLLSDHPIRCYMACVLINRNVLNDDGTLNISNVMEKTPHGIPNRENIIAELKTCANEAGEDVCETAYKTILCLKSMTVDP